MYSDNRQCHSLTEHIASPDPGFSTVANVPHTFIEVIHFCREKAVAAISKTGRRTDCFLSGSELKPIIARFVPLPLSLVPSIGVTLLSPVFWLIAENILKSVPSGASIREGANKFLI